MADGWDVTVADSSAEVELRLRALPSEVGRWSRKVIRDAQRVGVRGMESLAPVGDPFRAPGQERNYDRLIDRIGSSEPVYMPGGAGGGGTWTGSFGVREEPGAFDADWKDPALLVFRGTGIFAGRGPIRPTGGQALMWGEGLGQAPGLFGTVASPRGYSKRGFTKWYAAHVKGQPPQTEWVKIPRARARILVRRHVQNFLRS